MRNVLKTLDQLNLRKTPIRKEVLQIFLESENKALSNRDIELKLENLDRITLYRTLKTFEENGLIHKALDGSGTIKYALCLEGCNPEQHIHDHAHFHCASCGKTICIESETKSQFKLPKGYSIHGTHLIVEGLCADCQS